MYQILLPCTSNSIIAVLTTADPDSLTILREPHDGLAAWRLYEQTSYRLILEGVDDRDVQVWMGEMAVTDEIQRVGDGALCDLNWGNFVGPSHLRVDVAGKTVVDLPVEVRSFKLDYQTHYRQLLDELSDWLAALCFGAGAPTVHLADAEVRETTTPYLTYLLIAHLMDPQRLPAAVRRIALHPHRELVRESVWREFSEARNISSRTVRSMVVHGEHLMPSEGVGPLRTLSGSLSGHIPTRLEDERTRINLDTAPNRFVRHTLETLSRMLRELEQAFIVDSQEHPARAQQLQALAQDCRGWSRQVAGLLRQSFLSEVGRLVQLPVYSQVLLQQEGYRQVRDAYSRLLLSARVQWDGLEELLRVPNKDLATLYEYWCCFALADAGARCLKAGPDWSDLLIVEGDTYQVRLNKSGRFQVPMGPVTLAYNPWYCHSPLTDRGSFSLPLHPDFAFRRDNRHWIFDAKYRVDSDEVAAAFEAKGQQPEPADGEARSFKRNDLYKMHTYRDAIKGAVAAFTLYPGDDFRAFGTDGQTYHDPASVPDDFAGVGAVPLLPSQTRILEALLERIF